MIHLRSVFLFTALWVLLLGCGQEPTVPQPKPKPNVFLISIDTLRADHLGLYGYHRDTSPFLDQLAGEGVWVENAMVATHGTAPSHASMLTSVPQEVHGVGLRGRTDDVVPASLINLPEVFKQAGYRTIAVTGGGNVGGTFGFSRGFDVFDDRARGVWNGHQRLLKYLAAEPADQPVFVFFHTYEVHSPYKPPADLLGMFGPTDSQFPTTSESLVAHAVNAAALSAEDMAHVVARYDEGIRHTDRVLKGLFDSLRAANRLENSIVAVTSDHGEEFGDHGGLVHRDLLYEELVHVPMFFWGSEVPEPGSRLPVALSLDLAPTLTSCAGLPTPETWAGRDLLCLKADHPDGARAVIFQYADRRYGVRQGKWKLIVSAGPGSAGAESSAERQQQVELYDLSSDPDEQINVAAEHNEVVGDLMGRLRRWKAPLKPVASESGAAMLSEEERKRLESLGYLSPG